VKAYVVGGAVRDELLGLALQDKDYVVVGATPEEMVAQGFKPVGKDFPVFLHPRTHEEYALARTERKRGRGYKGFTVHAAPDVTLEDDLRRRDLTINAMAKDPESGTLIDPFHGKQDLEKRILRHVSEAFAEDPVRILRVARFAARFGFRVAEETMQLMREMVRSGEADYLVPERVWQEFERGLAEPHPDKLFEVLEACGLAEKLLNGVKRVPEVLVKAAKASRSVAVRFAVIAWPHKEPEVSAVCERLKAPNEVRELALLACRSRVALRAAPLATAAALLELLKRADAFRRPERFRDLLEVARLASPGLDTARLERALAAAAAVDGGAIAARAASPAEIPALIDEERRRAIERDA
jgi:tRNA nucleotidyltransferase (CCA-adding enzyme)